MTFRLIYVLAALVLMPSLVFAGCRDNPRECKNWNLCTFAADPIHGSNPKTYKWSGGRWSGHAKEAQRRRLTCRTNTQYPAYAVSDSIYRAFTTLEITERKELQLKLKDRQLYKSKIDGLYGKNTQTALKNYINNILNLEKVNDKNVRLAVDTLLGRKDEIKPIEKEIKTATLKEELKPVDTLEQRVSTKAVTDLKPMEITEELMAQRLSEGDFQSAVLAAKILAPQGNSAAQFVLGNAYAEGVGVLQQFKFAHMWLNIASLNGSSEAVETRNELQKQMTPDAIMEAQELAINCIQSKYKNCGNLPAVNSKEFTKQDEVKPVQADEVKQTFLSSSNLRRKQIQYALKDLGLYASSIDAMWGAGTERGIENYIKLSEQGFMSAQEMIESLLAKVDVPKSFAANIRPKNTTVNKVAPKPTVEKPNFRSPSGWRSFANVSVSFEQADAICRPQARNAGRGAQAPSMYGSTVTNCSRFGNSFNCNSDPSGFQGFANAMASLGAEKNAYNGCMAQYGWKRTKKQGLFER